jgi:hypothetical protein
MLFTVSMKTLWRNILGALNDEVLVLKLTGADWTSSPALAQQIVAWILYTSDVQPAVLVPHAAGHTSCTSRCRYFLQNPAFISPCFLLRPVAAFIHITCITLEYIISNHL